MQLFKRETGAKYTFLEYLKWWYQEVFIKYAAQNYQVGYYWCIWSLIEPNLEADIPLNRLEKEYLKRLLKRCCALSESAGPLVYKMLRICLNDAVKDELLLRNPILDLPVIKWKKPKKICYTKEEIYRFLEEASKTSNYLEILLALLCGLRSGEILGLRFSDFSYENKTVCIKRQLCKDYGYRYEDGKRIKVQKAELVLKPPKNKYSKRTLRIPEEIFIELEKRKAFIENLRQKGKLQTNDDFICISVYGKVKNDGTLLTSIKRICNYAGTPELTVHGLRHLCITLLAESGKIPLETISRSMGHSNINTTVGVYMEVIEGEEQIQKTITSLDPRNSKESKEVAR